MQETKKLGQIIQQDKSLFMIEGKRESHLQVLVLFLTEEKIENPF